MDAESLAHVLTVTLISFGVTFTLTPVAKWLAKKLGIFDLPAWRKLQRKPVPLLGGTAVYAGFAVPFVLTAGVDKDTAVILVGGALFALLGLIDDLNSLHPLVKLAWQTVIATVVVIGDGRAAGNEAVPVLLWIPLMVLLVNAWNLIDGMDGLATSTSILASAGILGYSLLGPAPASTEALTVATALLGSSLGFLPHNLPPARIYLGDSGSLLLGYAFAMALMMGNARTHFPSPASLLLAGVPLLDVAWAVFRRLRTSQPLFRADKKHIHHLLLDAGFTPKETLAILLSCQGLLLLAALVLAARSA